MPIHVPEEIGGKLKVLPEDSYTARIQDVMIGKSKASDQPKLTVKWVITSEASEKYQKQAGYESTIGENVLETFSLQSQALWNLNDLFIEVTGDRIPQADYSEEEFLNMCKDQLIGGELKLRLVTDSITGEERSRVDARTSHVTKGKKKK